MLQKTINYQRKNQKLDFIRLKVFIFQDTIVFSNVLES